jgi:thiamine biosynthesis lipoprotein
VKSLLCLLIIFLSGCQGSDIKIESAPDRTTVFSGEKMTMRFKVIIGQSLTHQQETEISLLLETIFREVNNRFNKWNPLSELSRLNNLKANEKIAISRSLQRLLNETQAIVEITKDRFDPTIEPLQKLWKQKLNRNSIPSANELADIAPAIGWDKVHFDDGVFYKDHDLTQLDLGGIAKGFCIDFIAEKLYDNGYLNTFVEWGGEIRASGQHPDSRPWTIYISRLWDDNPENAIAKVYLENQAIATSGDYFQNWSVWTERDTVTYFHIFDPHTLRPLEANQKSIASASVVAGNCAFADGLATAAMMFPTIYEAEQWASEIKERFPEISIWLISRHNDKRSDVQ